MSEQEYELHPGEEITLQSVHDEVHDVEGELGYQLSELRDVLTQLSLRIARVESLIGYRGDR